MLQNELFGATFPFCKFPIDKLVGLFSNCFLKKNSVYLEAENITVTVVLHV